MHRRFFALGLVASFGAAQHPGREDAQLARLFTPPGAPPGAYRVLVTDRRIDDVARWYREGGGAWTVAEVSFFEAAGAGGPYDRAKVARLFRSRRARLARGQVMEEGKVIEAVTLVSPYPDARLETLKAGTMIIVLSLR